MNISLTSSGSASDKDMHQHPHSDGHNTSGNVTIFKNLEIQNVPEPPLYILVTAAVFYVLIFLVGICGNFFIVCVVGKFKYMRTRMGFMFMNLAVTDILVLLICMPSAAIDLFAKEVWYFGELTCKLVPYVENCVTLASVLTILAITVDRYNGICCPTSDNEWKRFRVIQKIAAIWVVASVSSIPVIFIVKFKHSQFHDGTPIHVCRQPINSTWKVAYIMVIFVTFFIVTLIALLVMIYRMTVSLLRQRNLFEGQNEERHMKAIQSRRKVVIMLVLVIVCFFACLLPQRIVGIWFIFADKEDIMKLGFEGYLNLLTFIRVLLYLNSALNPVIYNSMSTKFRRVIMTFTRRMKRHEKNRLKLDVTRQLSTMTRTESPMLTSSLRLTESKVKLQVSRSFSSQRPSSYVYS